ncbi:similar to replication protein A 32 kDa subunit [Plenodomus lingam JN3]|uniref:Similar to replication protein A 32 kDa subunit n=1 Tax=Leptosphaeria maculans (strain JN3 / isolate v23.1.3 / race Av1-4-5-6-7-8) TaxID=985895 RepID=E4ZLV1_LEPMJ|nr:similar to replication protein A 32 kDa subunit [Plenodomus lingam JN3]CBX92781.1 similar to replication protein A 32 kDa subunit [Plenodomus lingam JN3]
MNYNSYETSYTSYGAGGGAGGGGFIPGEGGSQQSPGGRREHTQDSLRPVTIKQILEATTDSSSKDEFKIDGAIVTFVGQIRNISTQTTNTTYRLDDGTGSIEVKQWVDSDAVDHTNPAKAKLVEGAYCRAWGKLKSFNDRKSVGAQIIRAIEDMNEISYHLLEATAVHLYFTRGPPGAANTGVATNNAGAGQQQQATSGNLGGYNLSTYTPVARRVFQFLREAPQSNEGLNQHEIAAKLGIDTAEVARAGDDLLAGGLIYTTVDDQTWAVLEAE